MKARLGYFYVSNLHRFVQFPLGWPSDFAKSGALSLLKI